MLNAMQNWNQPSKTTVDLVQTIKLLKGVLGQEPMDWNALYKRDSEWLADYCKLLAKLVSIALMRQDRSVLDSIFSGYRFEGGAFNDESLRTFENEYDI